jgi:PilZ domain
VTTQPVGLNTSGRYVVTCKDCDKPWGLQREQLPQRGQTLEILCLCGNVFQLACDNRRFIRKPVELAGYLGQSGLASLEAGEAITILDISLGGLCFQSQRSDIQVGDQFNVRFFLGAGWGGWIEQDIIVRHVQDTHMIGAEFVDPAYNADLDLYLTSYTIID